MAANVTNATCSYGLAQTSSGCATTLATLAGDSYTRMQIIYCVAGFAVLSVSTYKLARAVRTRGAMLQKQIFALCMYAALTITLRGVDPSSYGHYIPRPVSSFLADSCTATLHTILIKSLSFYISITQHGVVAKRQSLIVFERLAIAFIWSFYIACDVSLVQAKGFGGVRGPVTLYVSAGFLFVLSTSFVVYGRQVIRRLEAIDRMEAMQHRTFDSFAATTQSTVYTSHDLADDNDASNSHVVLEEPEQAPRKPADRIRKVLLVTETVSLLSVAAQVYIGITRERARVLELDCANGVNCTQLRMHMNPLYVFQYVWIWIVLWAYWRTQRREPAIVLRAPTQYKSACTADYV